VANLGTVLECKKCGNVVAVIKEGGNPEIHCCGEAMSAREL
jgi:desulfoferrodoxin-like iron-binding protein